MQGEEVRRKSGCEILTWRGEILARYTSEPLYSSSGGLKGNEGRPKNEERRTVNLKTCA